ncbi:HTH-type transcriptional regulator LutR [Clostridiales bacterium]|nr:HTH-type transcriptional regulator LutR [Clostridiales bacterium]
MNLESGDVGLVEECGVTKNKAYEKVVNFVNENIANGELKIGDKLPTERELSEMLELSRNSVREALRTMDNMGLISCKQGSGNYLTGNLQKIIEESMYMMSMLKQINDNDICQLRRGIDILAMRLAIKNYTDDKKERIEELLEKISITRETEAAFIDKEIHMLISEYSNNKLIELINASLSITLEKFIFKSRRLVIENDGDVLTEYHKQMLESLIEQDVEKGIDAINNHYDAMDKYLTDFIR